MKPILLRAAAVGLAVLIGATLAFWILDTYVFDDNTFGGWDVLRAAFTGVVALVVYLVRDRAARGTPTGYDTATAAVRMICRSA